MASNLYPLSPSRTSIDSKRFAFEIKSSNGEFKPVQAMISLNSAEYTVISASTVHRLGIMTVPRSPFDRKNPAPTPRGSVSPRIKAYADVQSARYGVPIMETALVVLPDNEFTNDGIDIYFGGRYFIDLHARMTGIRPSTQYPSSLGSLEATRIQFLRLHFRLLISEIFGYPEPHAAAIDVGLHCHVNDAASTEGEWKSASTAAQTTQLSFSISGQGITPSSQTSLSGVDENVDTTTVKNSYFGLCPGARPDHSTFLTGDFESHSGHLYLIGRSTPHDMGLVVPIAATNWGFNASVTASSQSTIPRYDPLSLERTYDSDAGQGDLIDRSVLNNTTTTRYPGLNASIGQPFPLISQPCHPLVADDMNSDDRRNDFPTASYLYNTSRSTIMAPNLDLHAGNGPHHDLFSVTHNSPFSLGDYLPSDTGQDDLFTRSGLDDRTSSEIIAHQFPFSDGNIPLFYGPPILHHASSAFGDSPIRSDVHSAPTTGPSRLAMTWSADAALRPYVGTRVPSQYDSLTSCPSGVGPTMADYWPRDTMSPENEPWFITGSNVRPQVQGFDNDLTSSVDILVPGGDQRLDRLPQLYGSQDEAETFQDCVSPDGALTVTGDDIPRVTLTHARETGRKIRPLVPRKQKSPTVSRSRWSSSMDIIRTWYIIDRLTQAEIVEKLERESGLTANVRQLRSRLDQWKLYKNKRRDR